LGGCQRDYARRPYLASIGGVTIEGRVCVSVAKPSAPVQDVNARLKRAENGDKNCLPQLGAFLGDGKQGRHYRETYGSPAGVLCLYLIDKQAGKNLLVREALHKKLDNLRAELEGPNPTPIERLLAERASIGWLIMNLHELAYADSRWNISHADLQHRKIDKAHARFLSAMRTLA
jgi:hypothetical protein